MRALAKKPKTLPHTKKKSACEAKGTIAQKVAGFQFKSEWFHYKKKERKLLCSNIMKL